MLQIYLFFATISLLIDIIYYMSTQIQGGLNSGGGSGGSSGNIPGGFSRKVSKFVARVTQRDTDVLADYFQTHPGNFVRDTNVRFSSHTITPGDPYLSRIARYVRSVDPSIFREIGPDCTRIHGAIIGNIRALNLNVPANFR